MDAAVHDDAAAAAGAEDDPEHDSIAGAGTVGGLAEGEAVGVVLDADLAVQAFADVVVEAVAVQGDGVGALDQAGGGADDARDADADCGGDAEAGFAVANQGGDGAERVGVAGGRGDAVTEDLRAGRAEGDDFDLGAAEVDADSMGGHATAVYQRVWGCRQDVSNVRLFSRWSATGNAARRWHAGAVNRKIPAGSRRRYRSSQ